MSYVVYIPTPYYHSTVYMPIHHHVYIACDVYVIGLYPLLDVVYRGIMGITLYHYLCRTLYTPTYTGYGVVVVVLHTTYIMLWVCIHYSAVVGYYGYSVVCIVHDVFLSSPPTTTPLPTPLLWPMVRIWPLLWPDIPYPMVVVRALSMV